MARKKVRIAIVGMGIGKANGNAIQADPRGEIVALCDLDEGKMDQYEKELGTEVKKYSDYKKLCKDKEVDAIFIGTPNQWHVPIGIEAVKNDKHVLVTKPIADSDKAAARFVKAAEAAGVVNMMSLSTRFNSSCRFLGEQARKGVFGDLYYARSRSIRRSGIPNWSLGFIEAGGGAFRDMGVHALDAIWWLLGMPKPISVVGAAGAHFGPRGHGFWNYQVPEKSFYSKYDSDDYAGGFIKFEGGIGLQIESFWACHQRDEFNMELFGTEAGATYNPLTIYRTVDGAPCDTSVNLPKSLPSPWSNIGAHFIECILDGKDCEAPLRHGLIVQQMMEALLKSAETDKEVRVKTEM